jgi:tetratricopeptide (TPR) repeat protein
MQMSSEKDTRSVVNVVHSAWDKLQAGDINGALILLSNVEAECTRYSTYHVVLGSALLTQQEYGAALEAASRALHLSPESPHAKLIAEISRERIEVSIELEPLIVAAPQIRTRTLAALLDPIPSDEPQAPQFNIDKTADELTRERPLVRAIPEPEPKSPSEPTESEDGPSLVSETLADIMIRQGKLKDAKKVYIQLSRLQPERYDHFATKIEAIDKLLLGTSIAPETTPPQTTLSDTTDNDPVA